MNSGKAFMLEHVTARQRSLGFAESSSPYITNWLSLFNWAGVQSSTIPALPLYAPFDADHYAAPDFASTNTWRFGFDPDRQGGSVDRLAALDDLGFRQPTLAASDGRFDSARDGLPESSRNSVGGIPSDQRGFRRPNRIGCYR